MTEKKDSRRVLMTKHLIKTSLIELLKKKPVQDITITEICENADINRSTFYKYYGSPSDVMLAMKRDLIEDTRAILTSVPNVPKKKQLKIMLERHLLHLIDHLEEFMAFSPDVGEDFSLPAEMMTIIIEPYLDVLFRQRENERKAKGIPSPENLERTRMNIKNFCIFGTIGIVKNWIRSQFDVPINDLSNQIIELIDELVMGGTK